MIPAADSTSSIRGAWGTWPRVALLLVFGLAAFIRLWDTPLVFTDAGIRLTEDSDPHYHVLRAERWLRGDPGAPWRDPSMNWPHGADLPWPPLFDVVVAGTGRLIGGPEPTRAHLEAAAAVLPVFFGLLAVLLAAAVAATLLGRRDAWIAALAVAALPISAEYGRIGRGDQHGAELVLSLALLLLFLRAVLIGSGRSVRFAQAALAVVVALAFWTWQGSAISLLVPSLFTGCAHVLWPGRTETRRAARALLVGVGGGSALLTVTISLLGPPGALGRTGVNGIGGLHAAIAAGAAGFGGLLLVIERLRSGAGPARRMVEVALAAAVPAVLALGFSPGLRDGAVRGLDALLASNAWYESISEFEPFLGAGREGLPAELFVLMVAFGLFLPALALAVPACATRWRERPEARPALLAVGVLVTTTVLMALLRRRLGLYAAAPLGVAASLAFPWAGEWLAVRIPAGWPARLRSPSLLTASLAVLATSPTMEHHRQPPSVVPEPWIQGLTWLGRQPPPPGREAVAGQWELGHLIQFYAGKPVLASPFGVEGGAGALEDWAGILLASDEAVAVRALRARRVGFLVLYDPASEIASLQSMATSGSVPPVRFTRSRWSGAEAVPTDGYWSLVSTRLFLSEGQPPEGETGRSLGSFRLLWQSPGTPGDDGHLRIFGVVEGARLVVEGARPGAGVRAAVRLTRDGASGVWASSAGTTGKGFATLRLPYATGVNGTIHAGEWAVSDGARAVVVSIAEEDVRLGREVRVHLGSREPP